MYGQAECFAVHTCAARVSPNAAERTYKWLASPSKIASTKSPGAPISIERDNDRASVVALREIPGRTISTEDLKEDLIHSLQKQAEIDQPEEEAAPPASRTHHPNILAPDDPQQDVEIDRLTEEELLRRLAQSIPAESEM
jgi:DNA-directed RNA polymerase subunit omega